MADHVVTVFNRFGVALAEIEPDLESASWRLDNVGQLKFTMAWSDPKCTREFLQFGNRILVEFANGLPDWGGVIDPPRRRQRGKIGVTAYTGEQLLDWRVTDRERYFDDETAGAIGEALLDYENAEWATGITAGTIEEVGTGRTLEYHYHDLLGRLQDLARLTGQDFWVGPVRSAAGVLTFELHWLEQRGDDLSDEVWLIDGRNLAGDPLVDEQSPIANRVILVGEGTTWGTDRLTSETLDATSREVYGYREYSEVQSGVKVQATLDANADQILADRKDPQRIFTLHTISQAPALFSDYDVGDIVRAELFVDSPEWYIGADVRVLAREWTPAEVCRLEVQEVTA